MALKVLGQSAPSATTATDIYTVPSGKSAVVSTLAVANRGSTTTVKYRVSIRPSGDTQADEHYIVYDVSLPANSSDFLTLGISLAASDVVTVYAATDDLSFSLFGDES